MEYKLRRKVDDFLIQWKQNPNRMPLIIKGARQIGKTSSIEHFAESYKHFIEINFITEPTEYKIYYHDTGILIAALDEEAQADLRQNKNFNTYKGAIFENIVGDMLVKQGYELFYYKNEKATIEMDFFIRDAESLVPIEVKATDNATISLKNLIEKEKYADIHYGIKLCTKNIGFNSKFYTFPYFCTFLLKRYMLEKISSKEK